MPRNVQRFEDLVAWQRALDLADVAYALTRRPAIARDFALNDQIHSAAISVPGNIAEGFERGTRPEFHRFLTIAKASCGELRSHAHVAKRVGYLDEQIFRDFVNETEIVSRIIGKLRSTVDRNRRAQHA